MRIVPHLWKTGISIAAAAHLAAVTPHCDWIEFLPRDLSASGLRKDLTSDELEPVDGVIPLPRGPGLGVEVDREALAAFAAEAERVVRAGVGGMSATDRSAAADRADRTLLAPRGDEVAPTWWRDAVLYENHLPRLTHA